MLIRLQARAFRESCNIRAVCHMYKTLEKRFLLVIIIFSLGFGTIFTTITVYERLMMKMIASYFDYIYCHDQHSDGHTCSTYIRNYGSVTASIIEVFLFNVLSLVMLISTVWSRSARQFWRRHLLGLVRCCRKPISRGNSVEDTNER